MRILCAAILAYWLTGLLILTVPPSVKFLLTDLKTIRSQGGPLWKLCLFLCVVSVLWPLFIFGWNEQRKRKTEWDSLMQNPFFCQMKEVHDLMADMCEDGCDADQLPNGRGEFGYAASNPIPTKTVQGSIVYLSRLRAPDGTKIRYERQGSTLDDVSPHPIDIYDISHENGTKLATLYLSPYQRKISEKAPSNLYLQNRRPHGQKTSS